MKPRLSLKGRGLQLLAQREHSRSELRRKLMAHAESALEAPGEGVVSLAEQVDAALDWLQAHGHFSEARFVESRVHVRAARFGNLRIRQELAQHGLALSAEAAQQLAGSELERARLVWQHKFAQPAADAAGRARQMRFLAGRGFSGEVIRRVVQGSGDD